MALGAHADPAPHQTHKPMIALEGFGIGPAPATSRFRATVEDRNGTRVEEFSLTVNRPVTMEEALFTAARVLFPEATVSEIQRAD